MGYRHRKLADFGATRKAIITTRQLAVRSALNTVPSPREWLTDDVYWVALLDLSNLLYKGIVWVLLYKQDIAQDEIIGKLDNVLGAGSRNQILYIRTGVLHNFGLYFIKNNFKIRNG